MPDTSSPPRILYRDMRSRAEEIADEIIKEHVVAGIALLNEKYGPNWVDHVDPNTLIMSEGSRCVLGQVYGSYGEGLEALNLTEANVAEYEKGAEFGFYASSDEDVDWSELDDAWRLVLTDA